MTTPEHIGPYRVLDVLGEGGMGTIYLAQQLEPVERRVAVKVIKLGMNSEQVLARFDLERQALGVMNHDCIARVFDAGTTEQGQPFFVMEHVPGVPLTVYCEQNSLSLEDRIQLFRRVCAGVQHAHQKGVIHRDLKPSNILAAHDAERVIVKVIDFGLARATSGHVVGQHLETARGHSVGTPEYMSPEQATQASEDIDTRADVYSLGVILFELLTGQLPFPWEKIKQAGWREVQRVLSEDEPARPSVCVQAVASPALVRELQRDLDWIVLAAMSKLPAARYETANALSMDLKRYLDGEPVLAGPPTTRYRLTKFVRRYRTQIVAASLVSVVLVVFIAVSWYFYRAAESEAVQKERQRVAAEANAERARADRLVAVREKANADRILDRYDRLSVAIRLRHVEQEARLLVPAWPAALERLERWLDRAGRPLASELPSIRRVLRDLERSEAVTSLADDHPRVEEYRVLSRRVDALKTAMEVRDGKAQPDPVSLPASVPDDFDQLNKLAWSKVDPRRDVFGQEALGLALARRVVELSDEFDRIDADTTLAWALFANGLDAEARRVGLRIVREAPGLREHSSELEQAIAKSTVVLRAAQEALDALVAEVRASSTRSTVAAEDRFLHQALSRVERELVAFEGTEGTRASVERRLAWARRIGDLTRSHPRAKVSWREAREAIRKADGVVASKLYASHATDLSPQTGLVPIGMNPVTGLWEFYHLRSATGDPESLAIPAHEPDGTIRLDGAAGMVFVLLPGGAFTMGAQRSDRLSPNFDPHAAIREWPPHRVVLAPFFMARHEMSQGQWQRLSGGSNPSGNARGVLATATRVVNGRHPVERMEWTKARGLLHDHGLVLPSEAQWEYGCRAGTSTVWFSGDAVSRLEGYANLFDEFASDDPYSSSTMVPVSFDDGHTIHGPVGSFAANAFGLHDVHGNVNEWCRDLEGSYLAPWTEGSGLRQVDAASTAHRVVRGGTFNSAAAHARSATRSSREPGYLNKEIGLRAAREVLAAR